MPSHHSHILTTYYKQPSVFPKYLKVEVWNAFQLILRKMLWKFVFQSSELTNWLCCICFRFFLLVFFICVWVICSEIFIFFLSSFFFFFRAPRPFVFIHPHQCVCVCYLSMPSLSTYLAPYGEYFYVICVYMVEEC